VGHESIPSKWVGNDIPLLDQSGSILDLLDANEIGTRPTVFITHSLGGILAKAVLRASCDTPVEYDKHLLHKNTVGVVFFSTPHTGSSIANLIQALPMSRPTSILERLSKNDDYLRNLSQWFSDKAKQLHYGCLTYFEAHKTGRFLVVDPVSANPNHGMSPVAFNGDHLEICKLPDTGDQRYKQVLKFVRKSVQSRVHEKIKLPHDEPIEKVEFEIGVMPMPPQNGRVAEYHPTSRILTYKSMASRDSISIAPTMLYLDRQIRGEITDPIEYFWNPFLCQFPALDVMLVNNSDRTLVLSGATLAVDSSAPDFSPVIVIPSNTSEMVLKIKNEGWGKVTNAILKCNLLPSDVGYVADPPINHLAVPSTFDHEFPIGDFAESAEVNLRETLRGLGVDVDAIKEARSRSQIMFAMHAMQNGGDVVSAKHMGRFPEMETDETWAKFPNGYVLVVGRLEFESQDQHGIQTKYSLPMRARVFMFAPRMDLPMPPSYQYNAELEPTGCNYEVPVKLSQTLKSGDADRFTIRISCAQSAVHSFRIRWNFVGGFSSESQLIRLKHFVPRTFANEQIEALEGNVFDDEVPEFHTQSYSDCVEQSLMNTMRMTQVMAESRKPSEKSEGSTK
jgi:hypothetical protein